MKVAVLLASCFLCVHTAGVLGQNRPQPDWTQLQDETMRHFQALLRFDTSDPPGGEEPAGDLPEGGAREGRHSGPDRSRSSRSAPNVVARLKGNGSKRPLLHHGATPTS